MDAHWLFNNRDTAADLYAMEEMDSQQVAKLEEYRDLRGFEAFDFTEVTPDVEPIFSLFCKLRLKILAKWESSVFN